MQSCELLKMKNQYLRPIVVVVVVLLFQQFVNLPPPYPTKCENKTLKLYSTYTIEGCLHECELQEIERVCGCHLPSYPGLRILHYNFRPLLVRRGSLSVNRNLIGLQSFNSALETSYNVLHFYRTN